MARTIDLNSITQPAHTEVKLGDKTYVLKPITRTVQRELETAERDLTALAADDDAGGDKVVETLAQKFDVLLAPSNGGRTPASKIVLARWEADELTLQQIGAFFDALQEQAAERPT
jgi:hypothetical protein